MSKIENNKPLSAPEDAFEKDAAEGFGLISAYEMQALKAETDLAVSALLQNQPVKKRSSYWMAAALLIVGGLVIFLFLKPAPEQMAVQQTRQQPTNPETPSEKKAEETEVLSNSASDNAPTSISTSAKTPPLPAKKISGPVSERSQEEITFAADQEQISSSTVERMDLATVAPSAAPPAPDLAMRMEMAPAEKAKKTKEKLATSLLPASVNAAAPSENKISFKGGERALKSQLNQILAEDSLSKSLRLTFLLNQSAVIEKVEFVIPAGMSEARKKELLKKLSGIQGFQYETTEGLIFPQLYIFDFNP
jgi:hypothetical protein